MTSQRTSSRRADRRSMLLRLLTALPLMTMLGAAACSVVAPTTRLGSSGSATPTNPAVPVTDLTAGGADVLDVVGDWLTTGADSVWLSGSSPELYRLDPATGTARATIPVSSGFCSASVFWAASLWTATCSPAELVRIDPAKNSIAQRVPLPLPAVLDGETSIGAGLGGIWLLTDGPGCEACRIALVRPPDLKVTARVVVPDETTAVTVGLGFVWATNSGRNELLQIDARTAEVVRTIPTGLRPAFLAVGAGSVWVHNQGDGTVTRHDPGGEQTLSIDAGMKGAGGFVLFGRGSLWVRGGGDRLLVRIDPGTNQIVAEYGPRAGNGGVAVTENALWISAYSVEKAWRLPLPN